MIRGNNTSNGAVVVQAWNPSTQEMAGQPLHLRAGETAQEALKFNCQDLHSGKEAAPANHPDLHTHGGMWAPQL